MRFVDNSQVYTVISRNNEPSLTVNPGEVFQVHTELCTGQWLQTLEDIFDYESIERAGANPCVCIEVAGAKPGDMLAVDIVGIIPDNIGYTHLDGEHDQLPYLIRQKSWGYYHKNVRIENGFILWDDKRKLPIRPMIGTLATAPDREALLATRGGSYGGNMDAQEVCAGATIYFPVSVPGALLHIGDMHAIQGDGELNGAGGIECRGTVTLRAEILPRPAGMKWLRAENDEYIMAIACCRTTDESFYAASCELIQFVTERSGISDEQAYMLLAQVMHARCTQFINPTRTYVCKVAKKYL